MRGYSDWPEERRKVEGKDRGGEDEREVSRSNYTFLFFFFFFFLRLRAAAFRRIFVSRPSSARPKQQLLLFLAATFAILSSLSLSLSFSRPPFRKFLFPPLAKSLVQRNAHNYGHVTRLISWLNSLLGPDRPISSFDKEGSIIANRRIRFEHTLF